MGSEIVDLINSFTDQASENGLMQNKRNLEELKNIKSQVDQTLGKADIPIMPQAVSTTPKAEPNNVEADLMKKIKSKDSLIKEIDAQISRLDKLEQQAGEGAPEPMGIEKKVESQVDSLQNSLAKVESVSQSAGLIEPVESVDSVPPVDPLSAAKGAIEQLEAVEPVKPVEPVAPVKKNKK